MKKKYKKKFIKRFIKNGYKNVTFKFELCYYFHNS